MPNMIAEGAALVADSISDHLSETVTYRRGGNDITDIKAAPGQAVREVDTQYGVLRIVGKPWQFKASDLVYEEELWAPQKGDRIIESNGAEWDVLPQDAQAELVLGSFGYLWRVETKRTTAP